MRTQPAEPKSRDASERRRRFTDSESPLALRRVPLPAQSLTEILIMFDSCFTYENKHKRLKLFFFSPFFFLLGRRPLESRLALRDKNKRSGQKREEAAADGTVWKQPHKIFCLTDGAFALTLKLHKLKL